MMRKILIIIQRSNGDVLLSSPLIEALYNKYDTPQIDLLVNDDTLAIAKVLPHINRIHTYSYSWRKKPFLHRLKYEFNLIKTIYRKYDLSINLTASDRSVLYAVCASSYAISAIEKDAEKSWWKKYLLKHHYLFDTQKHILLNNMMPLTCLDIPLDKIQMHLSSTTQAQQNVSALLKQKKISDFIIFHPSAQYAYKVYPTEYRNALLKSLNALKIPIVVTGAKSDIDMEIKENLPQLAYMYDFIGETTLDEYIALSEFSMAYIGMDTLNMHIAAAQEKNIFAIFGPTLLSMWSPWSNKTQEYAQSNMPVQRYGNITIFQADMPCVACGLAGCDNQHGVSECLYHINPQTIVKEVTRCLGK